VGLTASSAFSNGKKLKNGQIQLIPSPEKCNKTNSTVNIKTKVSKSAVFRLTQELPLLANDPLHFLSKSSN
jgi:hypothetical protein